MPPIPDDEHRTFLSLEEIASIELCECCVNVVHRTCLSLEEIASIELCECCVNVVHRTFLDLEEIASIELAMAAPGYIPSTAQRRLAEEVILLSLRGFRALALDYVLLTPNVLPV